MSDAYEPIETVELIGGTLCLDFSNTASRRQTDTPHERLVSYGDLVTWSGRVGLLGPAEAEALRAEADRRPEAALRVLEYARAMREAIYRIVSAIGHGRAASAEDLAALDEALVRASASRRLVSTEAGLTWEWDEGDEPLARMLWPVVMSAADLLVDGDFARVKECCSPTCNWLFVDASRNRSRRWCDMKDCGNAAKARRHYARKRKTA